MVCMLWCTCAWWCTCCGVHVEAYMFILLVNIYRFYYHSYGVCLLTECCSGTQSYMGRRVKVANLLRQVLWVGQTIVTSWDKQWSFMGLLRRLEGHEGNRVL